MNKVFSAFKRAAGKSEEKTPSLGDVFYRKLQKSGADFFSVHGGNGPSDSILVTSDFHILSNEVKKLKQEVKKICDEMGLSIKEVIKDDNPSRTNIHISRNQS